MKLIDKEKIVAEIKRRISLFKKEKKIEKWSAGASQMNVVILGARIAMLEEILCFIDSLEAKDPYEECVQYASIKEGIQAHAETYSFNIESEWQRNTINDKCYDCKYLKFWGRGYSCGNKYA